MALEVEIVNGPGLVDILVAVGTTGAAVAAAYAAWMANRENKRLTERKLRFRFDYASDPGSDLEHAQLRLTISNDCFRPIAVSEVGFLVHTGGSTPADGEDRATLAVTTVLQDGGFGQWPFEPGRAVDRVIVALEDDPALVEMFARDSHGARHSQWCARGRWRRLRERYAQRRRERKRTDEALRRLRNDARERMRRDGS